MRYVRNMNEKYYDEMVAELYLSFKGMSDKIAAFCGPTKFEPQEMSTTMRIFPFPLAHDLFHTYLYLVGEKNQPEDLHAQLLRVCEIVWQNPFVPNGMSNIEWELWERTKLGSFVRCAFIAIALENGETINSKQLSMMAGITTSAIVKQIRENKIHAERGDREWIIGAEHALSFLKQYNDAAPKGGEVRV